MTSTGNIYTELLGLPDSAVRPNHYELLGVSHSESDSRVLKAAYYRRVAKISALDVNETEAGPIAQACQVVLAQLAEARDCLLDTGSRQQYDQRLSRRPDATPKIKLTREQKQQARAERGRIREALSAKRALESNPGPAFAISENQTTPSNLNSNLETTAGTDPDGEEDFCLREPAANRLVPSPNAPNIRDWSQEDSSETSGPTQTRSSAVKAKRAVKANSYQPAASDTASHAANHRSSRAVDDGVDDHDDLPPMDIESITVPVSPIRFSDRFKPALTGTEIVLAILNHRTRTAFQNHVMESGNPCSLVLGPYLIETQLHATTARAIDTKFQIDGGLNQRSVSWGPVYLATRIADGKRMTIRILPPNFRQELSPLRHWINKTSQIDSDAICHSVRSGRDEKRIFIASEFGPGDDLYHHVNRMGPLTLSQAIHVLDGVTDVLIAAEARRLRHPELRPGKILVDTNGKVRVRDFALANLIAARKNKQPDPSRMLPVLPPDHVQFFAPEHYRKSAKIDSRAEMYSLGCILRYLLTGLPPFELNQATVIAAAHQQERIGLISEHVADLPPVVDQFFCRLTAKDPNKRFANLTQLKKAIAEVRQRAGISSTRGSDWASVRSPAVATVVSLNKPSRFHTGRLIQSGLLVTTGTVVLAAGGMAASSLIEKVNRPAETAENLPVDAPMDRLPEQPEPKIIQTPTFTEVPEVQSVDSFRLD
jgi:serine/threonine protein kinase